MELPEYLRLVANRLDDAQATDNIPEYRRLVVVLIGALGDSLNKIDGQEVKQ